MSLYTVLLLVALSIPAQVLAGLILTRLDSAAIRRKVLAAVGDEIKASQVQAPAAVAPVRKPGRPRKVPAATAAATAEIPFDNNRDHGDEHRAPGDLREAMERR